MSRAPIAILVLGACAGPGSSLDGPISGTDGTGETPVPLQDAELVESGSTTCSPASERDAGVFSIQKGPPLVGPVVNRGHGAGSAVGDFDGDGLLDILIVGHSVTELFRQTSPGEFELVPNELWQAEPGDLGRGAGVAAADYDADGDLDIFVSRYARANMLLQNDGNGVFSNVAPELGLTGPEGPIDGRHISVTWSDYDNDDDLDLFVTGHGLILEDGTPVEEFGAGEPSILYRNNGDGTFTDVSDVIPDEVQYAYGFSATFVDLDNDGWKDLYMSNDLGTKHTPCLLAWNREGTFVLDDNAANLDQPISAMGTGVADVNEDGVFDLLLVAWGAFGYMLSSQSGVWIDYSGASGLAPDTSWNQVMGWAGEFADMDNDADLDAVVMFGYLHTRLGANRENQPNGIWLQGEDGNFTQVTEEWGFAHRGSSRGMSVADLDRNGYLDVVVPDLEGPSTLYQSNCGPSSWLRVELEMPNLNPDGIGSIVRVRTSDGHVQSRLLLSGGTSYASSNPPELHFGLGDHTQVELLEVQWPDGTFSRFEDVAVNQGVLVRRLK